MKGAAAWLFGSAMVGFFGGLVLLFVGMIAGNSYPRDDLGDSTAPGYWWALVAVGIGLAALGVVLGIVWGYRHLLAGRTSFDGRGWRHGTCTTLHETRESAMRCRSIV